MKKVLPALFLTASALDFATTYLARKRFGIHFRELSPYTRAILGRGGFPRMACAKGAGTLLGLSFYVHKMQSAKTKEDKSLAVQGFTLATCLLWVVTIWNSFMLFKHWKQPQSWVKESRHGGTLSLWRYN